MLAFLLGCSDSSPYTDTLKLLTNNSKKSWTVVSIDWEEETEGINCEEDDILVLELFSEETKQPYYQIEEGYVSCSFGSYVKNIGQWRLNNLQNRIILTYKPSEDSFAYNYLYDILELDSRHMVLRERIEDYSGFNIKPSFKTITYESR